MLKIINREDFDSVFKIMKEAFPETEIRTYEAQERLFKNDSYKIMIRTNEKNDIEAFLAFWDFKDFTYAEHFAVKKELRGKGIGKEILKDFFKNITLPLIFEVEPPLKPKAVSRIKFYKNLGCHMNDFEYIQPPLKGNQPAIPLKIMTYPEKITEKDFLRIKGLLYKEVYNIH
ncbi:MAG: GNAT family N-acetyltransferase [Lachnospiraceae bacterium]|nr:GNAT family N-acetyltransferase [Lachnospiraceae bacterium]